MPIVCLYSRYINIFVCIVTCFYCIGFDSISTARLYSETANKQIFSFFSRKICLSTESSSPNTYISNKWCTKSCLHTHRPAFYRQEKLSQTSQLLRWAPHETVTVNTILATITILTITALAITTLTPSHSHHHQPHALTLSTLALPHFNRHHPHFLTISPSPPSLPVSCLSDNRHTRDIYNIVEYRHTYSKKAEMSVSKSGDM